MPDSSAPGTSATRASEWSSGRSLTHDQRERKRAKNRVSSQKRRCKVRSEISNLRTQVAELTTVVDELRASAINQKCLERTKAVESEVMFNTENESENGLCDIHFSSLAHQKQATPTYSTVQPWISEPDPISASLCDGVFQPQVDANQFQSPYGLNNNETRNVDEQAQIQSCLAVDLDGLEFPLRSPVAYLPWWFDKTTTTYSGVKPQPSTAQDVFNFVLQKVKHLSPESVCTDQSVNEDVLLRGVLHGWTEVYIKHNFFCPLWSILRYLDQRIFCLSGMMTRFCTLFMIHQILLCFTSGEDASFSSLPAWYRPRQSQFKISHAPAIDVLPWPGLRERAIHRASLTESDEFWTKVVYDFRFHWPFPITEAFQHNVDIGLFSLSSLFQKYVRNLNAWQMDFSFFDAFPETYNDLVMCPNIPKSLLVPSVIHELINEESRPSAIQRPLLPLPLAKAVARDADPNE